MEGALFIVEHMEEELSEWVQLEYLHISDVTKGRLLVTSVPTALKAPGSFEGKVTLTQQDITQLPGYRSERVCLLDPAATQELSPQDCTFNWFLFGGILGDDPPRDRTGELRKYGFARRCLGQAQMTTDTAVAVVHAVVLGGKRMQDLPFVDHPELTFGRREAVTMPFRYLCDPHTHVPILPAGMRDAIRRDADKPFYE